MRNKISYFRRQAVCSESTACVRASNFGGPTPESEKKAAKKRNQNLIRSHNIEVLLPFLHAFPRAQAPPSDRKASGLQD